MDIQDELQTLYTSGTVFHGYLGEKLPNWQSAAKLVRIIAENYKLPYYTLSPTYSVCRDHGYLAGEQFECPQCGMKTEVYSRITGYYRPVQNWNDGKVQEYKERTVYNIPSERQNGKVLLFTTKTCPNCQIAVNILQKAEIPFIKIDAEEKPELAGKYQVFQAPTLIVLAADTVERYGNISEIRNYVEMQFATIQST